MKPKITKGWIEVLWSILLIIVFVLFSTTESFSSNPCPEGTWNRNQYKGVGGGLYKGVGGGLYKGSGSPYCTNRPPLFILRELGIIDENNRLK